MNSNARVESEIFSELANLCKSPGYLHAIAYFCFRDNTIMYSDVMTREDVLQQFSMERLVRTEISTLIGLACKIELNMEQPASNTIQQYIDKTEELLNEIHQSMIPSLEKMVTGENGSISDLNPFRNGPMLREPIFYGGESAYQFQYRDLSGLKYDNDTEWLIKNKGFSATQAVSVITAIQALQNNTLSEALQTPREKDKTQWNLLSLYTFSADAVSQSSGIEIETVINVINSFISPIGMNNFASLDDFNPKNAYPIIQIDRTHYLLFQQYSLVEALYETPFFWFYDDTQYRNTAMQHRGEFTESFSAQRLKRVFGENNVFQNIDIIDSRNNKAGEIDVLVVFSDRAIVLQAKSKRLTIASKKGNDLSLKDDFKKAVQDAYDQAYACSTLLTDTSYQLVDKNGHELQILRSLKAIYPFCVVSDHYPSLSFQARQFLNFEATELIKPPFVMDVFFLDVVTEMLESPLYFLSYVSRRTDYDQKILSTHELTILSYHLKQNLWINDDNAMMHLADDISADLDLAMMARREGINGAETPDGILTKFADTTTGRLIAEIEQKEESGTINLGFMLLFLSEATIDKLNAGIDKISKMTLNDGKCHDLTIGVGTGSTGLTIHCNYEPISVAGPKLKRHAEIRKYSQKAKEWFGICIEPETQRLKFGLELFYEWKQSSKLDKIISIFPKTQKTIDVNTKIKGRKIGRNEKCPCGSGIKYKKCCMRR